MPKISPVPEVGILEFFLEKYKPWMWFPPALSHEWMEPLLKGLSFFDESLSEENQNWKTWQPLEWKGYYFRNPVGIAGGVDKTAASIKCWWDLGVGFAEVGTITPHFQTPNPGKIIDRDIKTLSLWNRMGFPHPGYKETVSNLERCFSQRPTPILGNIGKNRWIDNKNASAEYTLLIHQLHSFVDIFVINISSPNTAGLRELFQKNNLKPFLSSIHKVAKAYDKPILLKLSPDEDLAQFHSIIDTSLEVGIDGFVLTNTTTQRSLELPFPKEGGVSGKFLAQLSKQNLKLLIHKLGNYKKELLVINAGGVFNIQDVTERKELGADLVQIYSGIVFNGPYVFKKIAREYFLKYT